MTDFDTDTDTDTGSDPTAGPGPATVTVRRPIRRRPTFHPLSVAVVDELTDDAVAVTFAVPDELRETFAFAAGQHLTVRRIDSDGEIRRSYSICSAPAELDQRGLVRIGVRRVAGGAFSDLATRELRAGHVVDVLPPLGHFTTAVEAGRVRHYGAVAAGSGITPVLSLLVTTLTTEPGSRFTLVFGNRSSASVMFGEELADLKDRFPGRLQIVHVLSREAQLSALLSGRIDADRLRAILDSPLVEADTIDEWFLCGPYGLVLAAKSVLADRGVPAGDVHSELFHVDGEPAPTRAPTESPAAAAAHLTVVLDGRESAVTMNAGERVLDAALRVRGELPYACRGGVCSTCRAKVTEGAVVMATNYALEPDELAAGYVLTCQSSPVTDRLVVDYDA